MPQDNKLDESMKRVQTQIMSRVGQPSQKTSGRNHKRSLSQQNNLLKMRSNPVNKTNLMSTQNNNNNDLTGNGHKRANSRDNLSKRYGKVCYPLVNTSLRKFNKKQIRMMTTLETVEDKDELNSSSVKTSQKNLYDIDGEPNTRKSRDFFHDDEDTIDILNDHKAFDFDQKNPIPNIMAPNFNIEKSEASALGFSEGEFDYDMDVNDMIERNDLSADIEPSFRYGDISYIKHTDHENNLNLSGIMNKSGISNKTKTMGPHYYNCIETIEEGNENSSSHLVSLDGSKYSSKTLSKLGSSTSPTPRREETKDDNSKPLEDMVSKSSSDGNSPFSHLERLDSDDPKDIK
jgi:hypothetical protein